MATQGGDRLQFRWILASFTLFCCAAPKPRTEALSNARTTSSLSPTNVPAAHNARSEELEARLALKDKLSDFRNSFFQRAQPAPIRPKWLGTFSTKPIASARAFAYGMTPVPGCHNENLPIERDGRMCGDVIAPGVPLSPEQLSVVLKLLENVDARAKALSDVNRKGGSYRARGATRCDFDPHHSIIFYDWDGAALGGVAVCFTCGEWRIFPKIRDGDGNMSEQERATLAGLFDSLLLGARLFGDAPASELGEYIDRVYGRPPDQLTQAGKARRARELARGSGVELQKDARSLTVDERARLCLWFQDELSRNRSTAHPGGGFECSNGRKFSVRDDDIKQCASSKVDCEVTTAQLEACLGEIIEDATALCAPALPAACRDVVACLPQIIWRPAKGVSGTNDAKLPGAATPLR